MECDCAAAAGAAAQRSILFEDDSPPGSSSFVAVASIFLLSVHAAVSFRDMVEGGICRKLWRQLRKRCEECRAAWLCGSKAGAAEGGGGGGSQEADALEESVRQGVQEKVQQHISKACHCLALALSGYMITFLLNIFLDKPRWMSFPQTAVFLVGSALQYLNLALRPKVVASRPWIVYSLWMLMGSLILLTTKRDPMGIMYVDAILLCVRAGFSIAIQRMRLVAFWNSIYTVAFIHVSNGSFEMSFRRMALTGSVSSTLLILLFCYSFSHATEMEVRGKLESAEVQARTSGLRRLLDMVCDVVVSVDGKLKILDQASRFSAMVTLRGGNIEGMGIQDFMPDLEDRENFEATVKAATEDVADGDEALPSALHAKLRDSLGNILRVELFCVAIRTPVRTSCLVGIREFSDEAQPLPEFPRTATPASRRRRRASGGAAGSGSASTDAVDVAGHTGAGLGLGSSAVQSSGVSSDEGALSDTTSSIGIAADGQAPRPSRRLIATRDMGIDMALVQMMELVVERSEGTAAKTHCCPLHRRVALFQERLSTFGTLDCAPGFCSKLATTQCRECGFLVDPSGDGARAAKRHRGWQHFCYACEAPLPLHPGLPPLLTPL